MLKPWVRRGRQKGCGPVLSCPWCLGEMRNAEVRGRVPLHTSNQPAPTASNAAFSASRSAEVSKALNLPQSIDASNNMHVQASGKRFAADYSQCMQSIDGATPLQKRECRLTHCCGNASQFTAIIQITLQPHLAELMHCQWSSTHF